MKKATENLENDHVHILRLIDVMEEITSRDEANTDHLETVVDLIRNFADGLHHNKEEKLLFPKLAEKGFSFEQGPIAVMIHEHVTGRNFVKGISDNTRLYKGGDKSALNSVYRDMMGYIELLRAHINKENNILFRMADKVLSDTDQEELLAGFARAEQIPVCGGDPSECIRQIDALVQFYGKK